MHVDANANIDYLTNEEASSLRALCESMLQGATDLTHPLFVQWVDATHPTHSVPATLLTVAFLPRALYALLRRAESISALEKRRRSR